MTTSPVPFEFKPPQYWPGMTAAERANEDKIKRVLMAHNDEANCYVCKSVDDLTELLQHTHEAIEKMHPSNPTRVSLYEVHEEIESALELVKRREHYSDRLKSKISKI